MAEQRGLQSRKQRHLLLAQNRQIATNASKRLYSGPRTETHRDFLLNLDHAQISFSEVIVERHVKIFQKSQNDLLVFAQTIQQIARGTLFDPTPLCGRSLSTGVGEIPFIQQVQETRFLVGHLPFATGM